MNELLPLLPLIVSLAFNIGLLWIIAGLMSRIDALAGEVERLRGVKSQDAGA